MATAVMRMNRTRGVLCSVSRWLIVIANHIANIISLLLLRCRVLMV
jgi:hypothetical protein